MLTLHCGADKPFARRLAAVTSALLVACAMSGLFHHVGGSFDTGTAIGALAAVLVIAAAARRVIGVATIPGAAAVGGRARAHREPVTHQPEPSHPTTAGRPLGRAPAQGVAATSH